MSNTLSQRFLSGWCHTKGNVFEIFKHVARCTMGVCHGETQAKPRLIVLNVKSSFNKHKWHIISISFSSAAISFSSAFLFCSTVLEIKTQTTQYRQWKSVQCENNVACSILINWICQIIMIASCCCLFGVLMYIFESSMRLVQDLSTPFFLNVHY